MKDLSLHILDIFQNSTRAKASKIELDIIEDTEKNTYTIIITDDGCGMDEETVKHVADPFFTTRTVRKVGLGIPLFKQNCEQTGGSFLIESKVNTGTRVKATFIHNHIDRPALGDIAGVMVLTALAYSNIYFIYRHEKNGKRYIFDTEEVKDALGGISMQTPEITQYLREMIMENLQDIKVDF